MSEIMLRKTAFTPIIVLVVLRNVFSVVLFAQSEASDGHPSSSGLPTQSRYWRNSGLLLLKSVEYKNIGFHVSHCPSQPDLGLVS